MEAIGRQYIVFPSRSTEFRLWNLADLHLGNRGVALDKLKTDLREIERDPFSFWLGGGDYAEYISPSDIKRWDASCVSGDIKVSDLGNLGRVLTGKVRDLFKPIKHKCLGLAFGNHEDKYAIQKEQQDLHAWLCQELGVPNLGYSAFLDVAFCRVTGAGRPKSPELWRMTPEGLSPLVQGNSTIEAVKRIFVHHGAGAAQSSGGKLNRLVAFMMSHDADIYFLGHIHDQVAKRVTALTTDATCTKILQRDRVGIVTGSYLRTYTQGVTGYGEKKGYAPVPLGARFVRVNTGTGEVRAEV